MSNTLTSTRTSAHRTSRWPSRLARTLLAPVLAVAMAALVTAPAHPFGAGGQEIVLRGGQTWRGAVDDEVEVTFTENGISQTLSGTLKKIEKLYITLSTTIAGSKGDKVIFRADLTGLKTTGAAKSAASPTPGAPEKGGAATQPGDSAVAAAPAATAPAAPHEKGADGFLKSPKPGVFVLPLEGTVGIGLRYQEMEEIAKEADKYGPGQIIVFLVDSPGGLVVEGDKIHDSLREIKKRHRLVAWIREAISGAAFTALHCDEIYFMRVGSLGAITMFAGQTAISGNELQDWLRKCTEVAELGGRSGAYVRAMIHAPLLCSYDKDPATGKVTVYDTLQGQYVLSDEKDNLVFNASNALDCGFSDGTADTTEELAKLLHLPEWYEISDKGRKLHKDWQAAVKGCQKEVPKMLQLIQIKGASTAEAAIGAQIEVIKDLKRWWDRCENVMKYELGVPPKDQLDRMIRDLQKQIADIKKARRNAD